MKLKIKYREKELEFVASGKGKKIEGSGIGDVLKLIEKEKDFRNIEILGNCKSYTFKRQIYLLANLLKELFGARVKINGKTIKSGEVVCPKY